MDAIEYIREFRGSVGDASSTSDLAARLRREPWPTVALVTSRLMGIGRRDVPDAPWFRAALTDVLLEAHVACKSSAS